jgi:hypothetical protein
VGRIAVLDHRLFNDYHGTCQAQFYFFDCEDNLETAIALFEHAFTWAKERGLNKIIGPKGFGTLDPFGILIEGFEHRQMMMMSNYNYPYYQHLVEANGFGKEMDFSSFYLNAPAFRLPDWIRNLAAQARQNGDLRLRRFRSVREGLPYARQMIHIYNRAMANNWEYYPLSEREITALVNDLKWVTQPRWLKIITHRQEMVGALLPLPDLSVPLQRAGGRLWPWCLFDLWRTMRRPNWLLLAWMGILPQFRLQGGNALLFAELEETLQATPSVNHVEIHQVADTVPQIRQDLQSFGLIPYKVHRVYGRQL